MQGPGQTVEQAEAQYDDFVSGQVQAAQEAQIKFWEANPGASGLSDEALRHFAMALHAVTDSTSPAHAGFQLWDWRNPFLVWRHRQSEKSITPGQLQNAVSATQRLFNQTFGMFGFDVFDLLNLQQQQRQRQRPPATVCTDDRLGNRQCFGCGCERYGQRHRSTVAPRYVACCDSFSGRYSLRPFNGVVCSNRSHGSLRAFVARNARLDARGTFAPGSTQSTRTGGIGLMR